MPEQLPFTELLNHAFGGVVTAALEAVGIHPKYPTAPINNAVAMEILVVLLLTLVFIMLRSRLSVENPGGAQHLAESVHGFFSDLGHELIGHDYKAFVPFLTTT